jgi:hypothetical protein
MRMMIRNGTTKKTRDVKRSSKRKFISNRKISNHRFYRINALLTNYFLFLDLHLTFDKDVYSSIDLSTSCLRSGLSAPGRHGHDADLFTE